TTCILLYALRQMRGFQPQERIWQSALERGQLFAMINVGLSPFVYWWNRLPQEPFYGQAIALLGVSSVLFLLSLNQILKRLSAMLPDETLRSEVGFFTALNVNLIVTSLALLGCVFLLSRINSLPQTVIAVLDLVLNTRRILMLFLLLLPLAMTMTLLWKTKEAVMASVFNMKG
ncbi:MAG TPA: hypothetical protein VK968_19590, partial [Roseimicrobium sp.]|nr:hypothetical protein [Roseimicrobium sp.]